VKQFADAYLWFGRHHGAEQLCLRARDQQFAKSGAIAESFLDLREELVRFYLDVLSRYDDAEPWCLPSGQS